LYEWILVDDPTLKRINVTSSQPTDMGTKINSGLIQPFSSSSLLSPSAVTLPLPSSLHLEPSAKIKSKSFGSGGYDNTANTYTPAVSSVLSKKSASSIQPSSLSTGKTGGGFVSALGLGLGGNQEAKDARSALLKGIIEARKGVLLSHDRLCANEDSNRKREELSERFHLLPSIMASTTPNCSQYDISLALKRRNVAKQHIKLLDSLICSTPNRTVPIIVSEGTTRGK
jgi:hypothetical protein